MKLCSKCNKSKDYTAFSKKSASKDGLQSQCKTCKKAYLKKYHSENLENAKEYRCKNAVKIKTRMKTYCDSNKVSKKEYNKKYFQENKKTLSNKQLKRRARDPLYRLKTNVRSLVRKALIRNSYQKDTKTADILGCSFTELNSHLRSTFEFNYGIPFTYIDSELLQIDHIIPLASAKTKEELLNLNHYSNVQYLFSWDNLEKGDNPNWEITV